MNLTGIEIATLPCGCVQTFYRTASGKIKLGARRACGGELGHDAAKGSFRAMFAAVISKRRRRA